MTPDISIAWLLLNIVVIAITLIWGIYRYRRGIWYRKLSLKFQAYLLWGIGGLALLSSFYPYSWLYTEHLWFFENVVYPDVFWKIIKIRWGLFFAFFFAALLFMNLNAIIAKRLCPEPREFSRWVHDQTVSFHRTFFCGSILIAIIFAVPMMSLHDEYILYKGQPKEEKVALANAEQAEPEIGDVEQQGTETTDVDQETTEIVKAESEDDDILDFEQLDTEVANVNVNENPKTETRFFGKDVNFYLFSYPMHKAISLWIQILFLVTCGIVGLLYNFYYRRDARSMGFVKRNIVLHGSILWLMLLAVEVWRCHVYLWGKVYTKSATPTLNSLFGLFYMDNQLADSTFIYSAILIGLSAIVILNLFWRRRLLWYIAIAVWCIGYISLIHVYPRVIHFVNVQTDELGPEGVYLEQHIKSTRTAFDLDTIQEKPFTAGPATLEIVNKPENKEILENIQIWDRQVLFDVLQAEHLVNHHDFTPFTDIDRYRVNSNTEITEDNESGRNTTEQYRQVLIAPRELSPAQEVLGVRGNWRKRKLHFTHGYGVYVSPVSAVNTEDNEMSPVFWTEVKLNSESQKHETISTFPELKVRQPRIYYGELTNDYVIVNTTVGEYDFETDVAVVEERQDTTEKTEEDEEDNEFHYKGTGGVQLSTWFRRLCFSIRFLDIQILYNKESVLTSDSRIMFWRRIGTRKGQKVVSDRLSHIIPFLDYDPDPYIVIADGQLWWIVDFYVTSRWYPNAQFYQDDTAEVPANFRDSERSYKIFNYIRNSGVAIVNAFTGEVDFYAVKDNEVITETYKRSFPKLFKGIDEMPIELRSHLRFPDYLTRIQSKIYKDYHVGDAVKFDRKSRQLKIPKEVYGGAKKTSDGAIIWKDDQEMMPYYAMIRLPGETKMEFVNMIPFTPQKKEFDMKAWLVARCDPPHYGERIVYILTNTDEVKGPKHVENLITSKLSNLFRELLSGNIVMRSGLQFIFLDEGIFHVEAIYQKPDSGQETEKQDDENAKRPMLVNIAVAANGKLAYSPILSEAVTQAVEVGLRIDESADNETSENGEKEPTTLEHLDALAKAIEDLRKAYINEQNGTGQKAAPKNAGKKKQNKKN